MKKILIALMLLATSAHSAEYYYLTTADTNLQSAALYARLAATNVFTAGNTMVSLTLSPPRWEDLRFPAIQSAKKGTDDIAIDEDTNTMGFATTATTNLTDDHLLFIAQIPHSYYEGSDLHPHIHFWQDNASQTNGFWLRYRWHNLGATNIPAWTVVGPSSNTQTYVSGSLSQLGEFSAISGSGKTVSSILDIKLYRDGTIGSGTIQVQEFDIHYQSDTPGGSANELTK